MWRHLEAFVCFWKQLEASGGIWSTLLEAPGGAVRLQEAPGRTLGDSRRLQVTPGGSRRLQESPGEALGDLDGSEAEKLAYVLSKIILYGQKYQLHIAFLTIIIKT